MVAPLRLRHRPPGEVRRRFRLWLLAPLALLLASQGVFALAVARFAPAWLAVAAAFFGWLALARRARVIWSDPPRPRFRLWLVDYPVFLHFGASAGALLLLPFALFAVLLRYSRFELELAAAASYGAGLVFSAAALSIGRHRVRVRKVEVELAGLPRAFDGYRIVQLSDLHLGSFDPRARGLAWARLANRLEPDLAVCTGDLVTSGSHYYEDAACVLGALRAADGTFAVLGNHDQWNSGDLKRRLEAQGVRVLCNTSVRVRRGGAALTLAGLDDAFAGRADLERTLAGREAGVPTLLLAHYPSFFAPAAERGVELVLSGHTHGGQIGVPFLGERLNLARLSGQFSRGLYRRGKSQLYVSAGLGTSGPPLRLGVPPEIALIVLRAA